MNQRDLYDMMQDPDIPADHKRAVLNQLQQQAEPDSSMPTTVAALLADAAAGTAAGSWLNKGDRAERYFGGTADWLKNKVQPADPVFGPAKGVPTYQQAHPLAGLVAPTEEMTLNNPSLLARVRSSAAKSLSPKTLAHLSGNVLGGMGMGLANSALVSGLMNKQTYQNPLGDM